MKILKMKITQGLIVVNLLLIVAEIKSVRLLGDDFSGERVVNNMSECDKHIIGYVFKAYQQLIQEDESILHNTKVSHLIDDKKALPILLGYQKSLDFITLVLNNYNTDKQNSKFTPIKKDELTNEILQDSALILLKFCEDQIVTKETADATCYKILDKITKKRDEASKKKKNKNKKCCFCFSINQDQE